AEDGIRDFHVTGVQTCALPISGCESGYSAPITIVQPAAALDVTAEAFHIKSCYGDNSGKVRLSVLGGTAPYTIEYGSELVSWDRSEERRVGKEGRSRWEREH